jgi:hypothetical protein
MESKDYGSRISDTFGFEPIKAESKDEKQSKELCDQPDCTCDDQIDKKQ